MEKHYTESQLVFVYGSLKRGGHNHHLLETSELKGLWRTQSRFIMYDLGPFPAVCLDGPAAIAGEVYQVDPDTMSNLDVLEGYPDWYLRQQIETAYGLAWIYYMAAPPLNAQIITSGEWQER